MVVSKTTVGPVGVTGGCTCAEASGESGRSAGGGVVCGVVWGVAGGVAGVTWAGAAAGRARADRLSRRDGRSGCKERIGSTESVRAG